MPFSGGNSDYYIGKYGLTEHISEPTSNCRVFRAVNSQSSWLLLFILLRGRLNLLLGIRVDALTVLRDLARFSIATGKIATYFRPYASRCFPLSIRVYPSLSGLPNADASSQGRTAIVEIMSFLHYLYAKEAD